MANKVKQHYGIKYPFTTNGNEGYFIDLNNTLEDRVASEIAHVILTKKGTRIRQPEFGTDLIKYVFEPNDELTWENVQAEIKETVQRYVSNVIINDVNVIKQENDDSDIFVDVRYGIVKGSTVENNRLAIKL